MAVGSSFPLPQTEVSHQVSMPFVIVIQQGGRSCAEARGAPAKKFGLRQKFKPQHTLFCRELRFVAIYALFGDLWAKKVPFWVKNSVFWARSALLHCIYCIFHWVNFAKGLTLVQALRSRVGAKGCWRIFFKNPTTQLRVVWGLTEKKCEQTPKFACFSVWRRPLHLSHIMPSWN